MDNTEATTKKALAGSATAKVAFVDEKDGLAHLFDGDPAGVSFSREQ